MEKTFQLFDQPCWCFSLQMFVSTAILKILCENAFKQVSTYNSCVGDEVDGGVDLVGAQAGVVDHRHLPIDSFTGNPIQPLLLDHFSSLDFNIFQVSRELQDCETPP